MNTNKFVRFVMIVGISGFYGISNAAIYDLGNLTTDSDSSRSNLGTTIGTFNIGSGHVAGYRVDTSVTDENLHKNSFEFTGGMISSSSTNDSARDVRHNRHYNLEQIKRKVKEGSLYSESKHEEYSSSNGAGKEEELPTYGKEEESPSYGKERDNDYSYRDSENTYPQKDDGTAYTPIASAVPEPETYAMILAGLGLIAITLRRRQEAP